jgi:decaprenylphospho-beta-D-erythro-pentofuranosid-2-ulose 2-reductase
MHDAFDNPGSIVLFGGTSDIGQAIVTRLATRRDVKVVLASRRPDEAAAFAGALRDVGASTFDVEFDAGRPGTHREVVEQIVDEVGDIDVAILAFGVLGHGQGVDTDPAVAAEQTQVNYVGAVSTALALAARMRTQGHGRIVVLSSVAGERVRKANFVYGSAKAGLDGFAQGLSDALVGTGVSVLIVRPGFVRSRMTEGLKPAPFATTAEAVGAATQRGLRRGVRIVWVPAILRPLFILLRHLPTPIWRRLPW